MKKKDIVQYPQTISGFEFFVKFMAFVGRIPFVVYHGIKGIKSISSNRNASWGSLLQKSALKYPNNPAVKSPDGTLTYAELNEKANQFAHFLLSKNVKKATRLQYVLKTGRNCFFFIADAQKWGLYALSSIQIREGILWYTVSISTRGR